PRRPPRPPLFPYTTLFRSTPDAAETLVRRHAEQGYHLQKIHPGLSVETWDRMAGVAAEVGLRFGGHVPAAVGLEHALRTGMSTVDWKSTRLNSSHVKISYA